jgi:hypothetical protein
MHQKIKKRTPPSYINLSNLDLRTGPPLMEKTGIVWSKSLLESANEKNSFLQYQIRMAEQISQTFEFGETLFYKEHIANMVKKNKDETNQLIKFGFDLTVNKLSNYTIEKVFGTAVKSDYFQDEVFLNSEVVHLQLLDSGKYFNKKVKDLNAEERIVEGLHNIILGVNNCLYLKWLYGKTGLINEEITNKNADYFELKQGISPESCFNVLFNNNFIDSPKKTFYSLFKKGNIEKVNWVGGLHELARFVFLLHEDYAIENSISVCKRPKKMWEVASSLFLLNQEEINPTQLKNSNRNPKDIFRMALLIKAVRHLRI